MAVHEVTQAEFQDVMASRPPIGQAANLPVDWVTRSEAISFCDNLTKRDRASGALPEGRIYRLPNQREWMIAAMPEGQIPNGATLDEEAWHQKNCGGVLHEVGLKKANEHGLHDLFRKLRS